MHKKIQHKIAQINGLRKRCDELIQLRSAWNNAYNSTLEALLEFDKNNTTEENKTFAETFALTVLYKQITENQNNARD